MESKKQTKFNIKINSAVHPSIQHTVQVNLRCYERMPKEKTLIQSMIRSERSNASLYCYEKMPSESEIHKLVNKS